MKKSINDLTVSRTFYKRNTDALGNRTREPYEKNVKREVQVVTGWTRFGHYLIDSIIIGVILFGINFLLALNGISIEYPFNVGRQHLAFNFIPTIDQIIITTSYYFICERTMQRTIGKFATDTVVIDEFANEPNASYLFGRSISRLVPFEAFSCLSDRGWHDRWSKTYVVKTKERDALQKLLNEQDGIFISNAEDLLD